MEGIFQRGMVIRWAWYSHAGLVGSVMKYYHDQLSLSFWFLWSSQEVHNAILLRMEWDENLQNIFFSSCFYFVRKWSKRTTKYPTFSENISFSTVYTVWDTHSLPQRRQPLNPQLFMPKRELQTDNGSHRNLFKVIYSSCKKFIQQLSPVLKNSGS